MGDPFRLQKILLPILSAKAANGVGTTNQVSDFRNIILQVAGASSPAMTVKVQASISDAAPDFSAAQSASNHWDYVAIYDMEDSSLIDGDTGIVLSGTDDFRNFLINTDGIRWLNCVVSNWSAGSVTVKAWCVTD